MEALQRTGSQRKAAEELCVSRVAIQNAIRREREAELEARGVGLLTGMTALQVSEQYGANGEMQGFSVRQGLTPEPVNGEQGAPLPGFAFKRISTNYGQDGSVRQQWEIQSPEIAKQWRDIERVIKERVERVQPRDPMPAVSVSDGEDMMSQVTIADGHVGAMAWSVETGSANWDLKIAHHTLLSGAAWLIDNLPPADTMLVKVLGDFTDIDGYVPATPASKHILDVDGRFPRIVDVAVDVIERTVEHALKRHKKVMLVIMPGNHDPLTAMWMRKLFGRIFQNEPRVEVEQSLRNIWCYKFGQNMIASSHGDKIKMPDLPSVLATDFASMWGETTHRYCHTGHLHHKHNVLHVGKQHRGAMMIQHPTASARNAWASELGYPEARELLGHSYHRRGGMVTTLHFAPEMLQAA
jgi:hypothetical protein